MFLMSTGMSVSRLCILPQFEVKNLGIPSGITILRYLALQSVLSAIEVNALISSRGRTGFSLLRACRRQVVENDGHRWLDLVKHALETFEVSDLDEVRLNLVLL